MKKIVCALVVLALAVPASAEVIITCVQEVVDEPNVLISYECTAGEDIRCFGLDIQLDNDETITAVECLGDDYYLNPQKFTYDGMTPNFGDTPSLCDYEPGLLGDDPNSATIAMCSLYAENDPDHNEPPAASGDLVRIVVSDATCITITENDKLGGVLDEDNNPPAVLTLPGAPVCVEMGCPCDGDINDDGFVAFSDVGDLVTDLIACSWFCMPGQTCWKVCDDYNEDGFMAFSDVGALVTYMIANGWFVICP